MAMNISEMPITSIVGSLIGSHVLEEQHPLLAGKQKPGKVCEQCHVKI